MGEGLRPQFKGEGVAVWVHHDKNNNQYLNIKILGNITLKAWLNKPKEKEVEEPAGPIEN